MLADCLKNPIAAEAAAGQMSVFFGDVSPKLQKVFAGAFQISELELAVAAKTFAAFSGETYPLAE